MKIILAIGFYLIGLCQPLPTLKKRMIPTSLEMEAIEGLLALEKGVQHALPASHPIPAPQAANQPAIVDDPVMQSQLQKLMEANAQFQKTNYEKMLKKLLATTDGYLQKVEQDPLSSFSASIMVARQEHLMEQGLFDIAQQEWKSFEELKRLKLSQQSNNQPSTSATVSAHSRQPGMGGSTVNPQEWIKSHQSTVIRGLLMPPEQGKPYLVAYLGEARSQGMDIEAGKQIITLNSLRKLSLEDKLYDVIKQNVLAADVNTKMLVDQAFLLASGQVEKATFRLREYIQLRTQASKMNHEALAPNPTRQPEVLKELQATRDAKHQAIIEKIMKNPLNEYIQDVFKNYLIDLQKRGAFTEMQTKQQFIAFSNAAYTQALQNPTSEALLKFVRIRNTGIQEFGIPETAFAPSLKSLRAAVIKFAWQDSIIKSLDAPLSAENLEFIEKLLLSLEDRQLQDRPNVRRLFEAYVEKFSGSTTTDPSVIDRVYRILDLGKTRFNMPDSVVANAQNQFAKNVWSTIAHRDLSSGSMALLDLLSQRLRFSLEERLRISETMAGNWNTLQQQSTLISERLSMNMKQTQAEHHAALLRRVIEATKSPLTSESQKTALEYESLLQRSGASAEWKDWERDHAPYFSTESSSSKRPRNH